MLDILFAIAAASGIQAAPAAAAPAAPQPSLKDIPGVTVNYYPVAGKNHKQLMESIAAQRPKAADGQPVPASTTWNVAANISKRTEGDQCTIAKADATFTGVAELPRLANPDKVDRKLLPNWNSYVATLESDAAAHLGFVYGKVNEVEQAIAAASCDGASAALDAATERLRAQERQFLDQRAAAKAAAAAAAAEAAKAAQQNAGN